MNKTVEKRVLELLRARFKANPRGFRSFMPDVAELLDADQVSSRPAGTSFGLTNRELAFHQVGFKQTVERITKEPTKGGDAVEGLQHVANLIRDGNLPTEAGFDTLSKLFKAAFGKSPGSFKSNTTMPLGEGNAADVVIHVSMLRGVVLNLDRNMRLVSVTVTPRKYKERKKLLSFVGAGSDSESDVSLRHDDYLAKTGPHGAI